MIRDSTIRVTIVSARYPHAASYYDDWSDAFDAAPHFATTHVNLLGLAPQRLARLARETDAIVLLHSATADGTADLERVADALAVRGAALLVAFVGNEYNSPSTPLAAKRAALARCRPDIVATQLLKEAGDYLYGDLGARVISLPHAVNPVVFVDGPRHAQRPIDIGVRAFRYSPLLGDADRSRIVDRMRDLAVTRGLTVDVRYEQRFRRADWAAFLRRCRGAVSSEAGSFYLDRDDALVTSVAAAASSVPTRLVLKVGGAVHRLVRRSPLAVKSWLTWALRNGPVGYAAFEEMALDAEAVEAGFREALPCPVYSKAISSRHFDAAGSGVCQILMEGRYNDILVAGTHFIPVARDLSDIAQALDRFCDADERQRIAAAARAHVLSRHTHAHRMDTLRAALEAEA